MKMPTRKRLTRNRRAKWRPAEPPKTIQLAYYKALMGYTKAVAAVFKTEVFPVALAETLEPVAQDAERTPLEAAFDRFVARVNALSKDKINAAARKMVFGVEQFQRNLFVSNIKNAVGVDVGGIVNAKQVKPDIDDAIKESYKLIKSIGPSYADRGRAIVEEALRTGQTRKTLEKNLLDLGGFTDRYEGTEQRRARTIARDQSQKFAKAIDNTRAKKIGAKHFYWVTVGDGRVRDEHDKYAKQNGGRYSYDNPPDGKMPGDDVNDRCHARPDTNEILEALERGDVA